MKKKLKQQGMNKAWVLVIILALGFVIMPSPAHAVIDQFIAWVQGKLTESKSYAVVIGIDDYKNTTNLQYAVNDAKAMAQVLKAMGFQVPRENQLLKERPTDPPITRTKIRTAIRQVLRQAGPKDRVLIFYAGHGKQISYQSQPDEAYLLPSNYNPKDVIDSGLAFKDLVKLADLEGVKANQIFFVLDACYAADALNASGFRDEDDGDALNQQFYQDLIEGRFVGVLTAGGQNQKVIEENGHGIFTGLFVEALLGRADANGNGVVHFREMITWLEEEVSKSTSGRQDITFGKLNAQEDKGQVVFAIPSDAVRTTILGDRKGQSLNNEVRKRQTKLRRERGEVEVESPSVVDLGRYANLQQEVEYQKKLQQAWTTVKEYVSLTSIPAEKRLTALRQFQKDFQKDNPYKDEAKQITTKLQVADAMIPEASPLGQRNPYTGQDGAPMVVVPAGEFLMGASSGDTAAQDEEKPQHRVSLDAFYIDQYEVNTSRYAQFMNATGRASPKYWEKVQLDSQGDRPVVGVTWDDAKAYCEHYDKRLPTEAEWEKAARGTDNRIYPWGNEQPTSNLANFDRYTSSRETDLYSERLKPVGSFEAGKSPFGAYDMAGNGWEWVADWYDENYYRNSPKRNPKGPGKTDDRVVRGGSWVNSAEHLRSSFRSRNWFDDVGFRCARTPR